MSNNNPPSPPSLPSSLPSSIVQHFIYSFILLALSVVITKYVKHCWTVCQFGGSVGRVIEVAVVVALVIVVGLFISSRMHGHSHKCV